MTGIAELIVLGCVLYLCFRWRQVAALGPALKQSLRAFSQGMKAERPMKQVHEIDPPPRLK